MQPPFPGIYTEDCWAKVPLDYGNPAGPSISIYARIITKDPDSGKPYLLFLQGGPGSEAPRPAALNNLAPWVRALLEDYQLVMLDQRGTGRSTPLGPNDLQGSSAEQAEYFSHFRAPNIVRDAEVIRRQLGAPRWTVLGQSFGGFCTLTYLSLFPEAVEAALFTGGLPAPGHTVEEVYHETWAIMREKSLAYYRHYPGDRRRMAALMEQAAAGELTTLEGNIISPEMLRRLGMHLGRDGGAAALHVFLEHSPNSPIFRGEIRNMLPFSASKPVYLVLHEACWADGVQTNWAAERTMPEDFQADPTLLAGEHVHRDFLKYDPQLAPYTEVAELLAAREWERLYDPERLRTLSNPAAAAIYFDDAYVPFRYSLETSKLLQNLRPLITNQYEHGGIHSSGDKIIRELVGHVKGRL